MDIGPARGRATRALLGVLLTTAALVPSARGQCELAKTTFPPGPWPILDTKQLGKAVAVHGDQLLVGLPRENSSASDAGSVRLYQREGDDWTLAQTIAEPLGTHTGLYGWELAMNERWACVGALHDDTAGNSAGAVHVYARGDGLLTPIQLLTASDGEAEAEFSRGLSLRRERLVVGANGSGANGFHAGAAYVFEWDGAAFQETARLLAPDAVDGDQFGWSVAQTHDTLVVGAPGLWDGPGKAYVYRLRAGAWQLLDVLQPEGLATRARFGHHVAIDGESIAVGAPYDGPSSWTNNTGAVYLYAIDGAQVLPRQRLAPAHAYHRPLFGLRLLLRDELLFVGAPGWATTADDPGHVHVFGGPPGGASELVELSARDGQPADGFGVDLALDGSRLVVGADYALLLNAATGQPVGEPGAVYHLAGALDLASWADVGGGLAGTSGEPCAFGRGVPLPDAALHVGLVDAAPTTPVWLVMGAAQAAVPFAGGVLVPAPDVVLAAPATSADGGLELPWRWPSAAAVGQPLWLQLWQPDAGGPQGWIASNALRVVGAAH